MSKKSKTRQTNKPVYESEIRGAHNMLSNVYRNQAPRVQEYADMIGGLTPDLIARYQEGDPAVTAARGYVTDTLGGEPGSNPYLDEMVALTGDNVRRQIQTQLGTRGGIGGTVERDIVSRALADNELRMRYQDYDRGMSRRAQAAGMAPGVAAGDLISLAPALSTAQFGATLPLNAASQYAAGTGGLLGQYQDRQGIQKSSPGILDLAGLGIQATSLFSDARLKTDVRRVGRTDSGLPIYTYRMGGEGPFMMGVMAQEAANDQPEALGPEAGGYMTVNYGEVR